MYFRGILQVSSARTMGYMKFIPISMTKLKKKPLIVSTGNLDKSFRLETLIVSTDNLDKQKIQEKPPTLQSCCSQLCLFSIEWFLSLLFIPIGNHFMIIFVMKFLNCYVFCSILDHKKLPFMAMLRNLRNLIKTGISNKHHNDVIKRLTNV
jgi:hypothetical protein